MALSRPVSVAAALLLLLCACSRDQSEWRFEDYHARLARSLKLDTGFTAEALEPARLPRKRLLQRPQADVRISMIEFLSLYNCTIHEIIGQRNSVLGKVAPASQRLFNDLSLLHHAPACVASLRADGRTELADTLSDALEMKRQGLAGAIVNATLASDEFTGLWQIPDRLDTYPVNNGSETGSALAYIESEVSRWLAGDYRHDASRFESALGTLRYGQAGHLIRAAALSKAGVDAANRLVQQRQAGRPLCYGGKPSDQGRILRRVIDGYFVGEIQAWLARVNAIRYRLLTPVRALETHLASAEAPAYRQWRERRDEQLLWLSSATKSHVQTVRPLLASCGLLPGS